MMIGLTDIGLFLTAAGTMPDTAVPSWPKLIYVMYVNGEYATRYFSSGVLEPKVGVATSENPISRHPSCTEAGIFLS